MGNINLLPEEFRKKEQKEIKKAKKKQKISVDFSMPTQYSSQKMEEAFKKPSLWQKMFGEKIKVDEQKARSKMFDMQESAYTPPHIESKVQEKWVKNNTSGEDCQKNIKLENKKSFQLKSTIEPKPENKNQFQQSEQNLQKFIVEEKFKKSKPIKAEGANFLNLSKTKSSFWGKLKSFFSGTKKKKIIVNHSNSVSDEKKYVYKEVVQPTNLEAGIRDEKIKHSNKKNKKHNNKFHLAPKQDAEGFDINLIPEELTFQSQPEPVKKIATLVVMLVISVIVVAGISYYINFEQNKIDLKISQLSDNNSKMLSQFKEYKKIEDKNIKEAQRVQQIGGLLKNHIYWTRFFAKLEKYTLDGVYFTNFSADTSKAISLPSVAKDYDTALKQIVALRDAKDFIKELKVTSLKAVSDSKSGDVSINFDIKIILADNIFSNEGN